MSLIFCKKKEKMKLQAIIRENLWPLVRSVVDFAGNLIVNLAMVEILLFWLVWTAEKLWLEIY